MVRTTPTIGPAVELTMTEAELQAQVLELARTFGWRAAHFRPALTRHGWRTAVTADGAGFVDLVLVGHGRVIFVELKSSTGKLTPEQELWRDALLTAGADWQLWSPRDISHIASTLSNRRATEITGGTCDR